MNTLFELLKFLKVKKKLWLTPLLIMLIIIGSLMLLAQGSVLSPFIYTLF